MNKMPFLPTQIISVFFILFLIGFQAESRSVLTSCNHVQDNSQDPVFQINSGTSEDDLKNIEAYFAENHPNLLVHFANIRLNPQGKIIGFDLQTKFRGESNFQTRLTKTKGKTAEKEWGLSLHFEKGPSLTVQHLEKNITLSITKDKVQLD